MKLTEAEPTEAYPLFHMISEGGRWEIGIYPLGNGCQIKAGLVNSCIYNVDYCAGREKGAIGLIFLTVKQIMSGLTEKISVVDLEDLMPPYEIRPIIADPCFTKLTNIAVALAKTSPMAKKTPKPGSARPSPFKPIIITRATVRESVDLGADDVLCCTECNIFFNPEDQLLHQVAIGESHAFCPHCHNPDLELIDRSNLEEV